MAKRDLSHLPKALQIPHNLPKAASMDLPKALPDDSPLILQSIRRRHRPEDRRSDTSALAGQPTSQRTRSHVQPIALGEGHASLHADTGDQHQLQCTPPPIHTSPTQSTPPPGPAQGTPPPIPASPARRTPSPIPAGPKAPAPAPAPAHALAHPPSPQPASNWSSDPGKAQLRRQMGISADLDSRTQEQQSREFRREVRRLAGIDFSKTWTELEKEGKTEAMICSILPPPPSS